MWAVSYLSHSRPSATCLRCNASIAVSNAGSLLLTALPNREDETVRGPFMGDWVEARIPLCNLQQCPQFITLLLIDCRRPAASNRRRECSGQHYSFSKQGRKMVRIVLPNQNK